MPVFRTQNYIFIRYFAIRLCMLLLGLRAGRWRRWHEGAFARGMREKRPEGMCGTADSAKIAFLTH